MLPSKWYLEKISPTDDLDEDRYDSYFLVRCNEQSCNCPYSKYEEYCGSWCPLFEIISTMYAVHSDIDALNETYDNGIRVVLHCGSGNAEYKIESIKGE